MTTAHFQALASQAVPSRMRTGRRHAAALLLTLTGSLVHAGAYCWNETLTQVITTGDAIYFTTDKSCPGWCQIDPTWSPDAQKRAYATLLTAKSLAKPVAFFWNELDATCASTVPTYAKPTLVDATF